MEIASISAVGLDDFKLQQLQVRQISSFFGRNNIQDV
jgi:hypothetical protein